MRATLIGSVSKFLLRACKACKLKHLPGYYLIKNRFAKSVNYVSCHRNVSLKNKVFENFLIQMKIDCHYGKHTAIQMKNKQ